MRKIWKILSKDKFIIYFLKKVILSNFIFSISNHQNIWIFSNIPLMILEKAIKLQTNCKEIKIYQKSEQKHIKSYVYI